MSGVLPCPPLEPGSARDKSSDSVTTKLCTRICPSYTRLARLVSSPWQYHSTPEILTIVREVKELLTAIEGQCTTQLDNKIENQDN